GYAHQRRLSFAHFARWVELVCRQRRGKKRPGRARFLPFSAKTVTAGRGRFWGQQAPTKKMSARARPAHRLPNKYFPPCCLHTSLTLPKRSVQNPSLATERIAN